MNITSSETRANILVFLWSTFIFISAVAFWWHFVYFGKSFPITIFDILNMWKWILISLGIAISSILIYIFPFVLISTFCYLFNKGGEISGLGLRIKIASKKKSRT